MKRKNEFLSGNLDSCEESLRDASLNKKPNQGNDSDSDPNSIMSQCVELNLSDSQTVDSSNWKNSFCENNSDNNASIMSESMEVNHEYAPDIQKDNLEEKTSIGETQEDSLNIESFKNINLNEALEEEKEVSFRLNSLLKDFFDNLPLSNTENNERKRTIRWADEVSKELEIVYMLDSDPVYSEARKGPWRMAAKRRILFKKRIIQLSKIISPILSKEFRKSVYKILYEDDDKDD